MIQDAPAQVHRSLATIYQWVRDEKVRTWRPGKVLFVYRPDLHRTEKETKRGRPRA